MLNTRFSGQNGSLVYRYPPVVPVSPTSPNSDYNTTNIVTLGTRTGFLYSYTRQFTSAWSPVNAGLVTTFDRYGDERGVIVVDSRLQGEVSLLSVDEWRGQAVHCDLLSVAWTDARCREGVGAQWFCSWSARRHAHWNG